MSEDTTNTTPKTEIYFALVAQFAVLRSEFSEWFNTYGHADKYDLEVRMETSGNLVNVHMSIAPTPITLDDLTITKQGSDVYSNSPLDYYVEKIKQLSDFDGQVQFVIADKATAETFLAEALGEENAAVVPAPATQEELWEKLDQKWTDFDLPHGMKGRLDRADIIYLGDIVRWLEDTLRNKLEIKAKDSKILARAKEVLIENGLRFNTANTFSWKRPEDRT